MDAANYNETVLDHFRNPRNAGAMEDANAVGEDRNPVCGDHMRLFLHIEDGVIERASFLTRGCGAAIAASSAATELLTGMSVEQARTLTRDDFVDAVDGLPASKVHCSVLAAAALQKALAAHDAADKGSRT